MKFTLAAMCFFSSLHGLQGQEIELNNPSFEDIPRHSLAPSLWMDCGSPEQTPPDVQPSGAWQVYRPALHGNTYLGMVTRENGTYEAVGQRLAHPLKKGEHYRFSAHLCTAAEYRSAVLPLGAENLSEQELRSIPEKNFSKPVLFEMLGASGHCVEGEILFSSPPVDHFEWRRYTFTFVPKRDASHLIIRAHLGHGTTHALNGNLLIDHLSSLTPVDPSTSLAVIVDSVDQRPLLKRTNLMNTGASNFDPVVVAKTRETSRLLSLILDNSAMQEHLTPDQLASQTIGVRTNSKAYFPIGPKHDHWKFVKPSSGQPHFEIESYTTDQFGARIEFLFGDLGGVAKFKEDRHGFAKLTQLRLRKL